MSPRPLLRPQRRRATSSRWLPESFREAIVIFFRRIRAVFFFLLAGVWSLIVLTYDSSDPSFNTASTSAAYKNWLGSLGSHAADIAWQTVGLSSLILVVVFASWGWLIWTGRALERTVWRLVALFLALLAFAFGLAALQTFVGSASNIRWGGSIGHVMSLWATQRLPGKNGALILSPLVALFGLGCIYVSAALMLKEWHSFWGLLRDNYDRALHSLKEFVHRRIELWRYGELDDDDLDEIEETADKKNAPEIPAKKTDKGASTSQKRARPNLIQRPAASARQASLALRPEGSMPLPPLELLHWPDSSENVRPEISEEALEKNARLLETVLEDFGVYGNITKVSPGPVVTLYELEPSPGTRSSRIISLADDIARNMSAASVRVAVVPGRNVIGIELPNKHREIVYLRELLCSDVFTKYKGSLPLVLGKDISGNPVISDLVRMPHLLIAGTTGSGKSVSINTLILSLIYRLPPEKCRFIMIDPKVLELSVYEGIPHLLAPVVTEPKKAILALKWTVREMEERYRAMTKLGARNIDGYNQRLRDAAKNNENLTRTIQTGFNRETGQPVYEEQPLDLTPLPYIVLIVDEMADLMIVAGKDIESAVQRLAQMARAAGIYLIMATQRPSVDVITGTIKANFPTRVSFQVTSKIDSRTILGEQGAEQLLGHGDMLYMAGGGRVTRVHGPFVSDGEVESIVAFLKKQGEPDYLLEVTEEDETAYAEGESQGSNGDNDLYDKAVDIVLRERKASTSFIQRQLQIGYNRAANIIERMERDGIVSQANRVGKREILGRKSDNS